jgi:hypothetical protein
MDKLIEYINSAPNGWPGINLSHDSGHLMK